MPGVSLETLVVSGPAYLILVWLITQIIRGELQPRWYVEQQNKLRDQLLDMALVTAERSSTAGEGIARVAERAMRQASKGD